MISFTVSGDPIAQPRHQVSIRGKKPVAYIPDDHPIHGYKEAVRLSARVAMAGQAPVDGPISLRVWFCIARPKSHSKARRVDHNHTQKPDASNLLKGLEDALNGICWADDSQITEVWVSKRWTETEPRTIIEIKTP